MAALEHVYDVLDVDHDCRMLLADHGVTDHGKLLLIAEDLHNGEPKLKTVQRRSIICYLDWSRAFIEEHQRQPEPLQDFTSAVFNEYQQRRFAQQPSSQFGNLLLLNEQPEFFELALTLLLAPETPQVEKLREHMVASERYRRDFAEWFVAEFRSKMPQQLKDDCSHFEAKYIEFIKQAVDTVLLTQSSSPFLIGGRTQAGKTSFKAVVALICNMLQLPLIIITKGVAESKELHAKLCKLLEGSKVCENIAVPGRSQPRDYFERTLEKHGVVVIADTAAQITRAKNAVAYYRGSVLDKRFAVIVDEVDDMYRTEGRTQKMEQAYDVLMNMDPSMKVMISATLVPLFVHMKMQEEDIGWSALIDPPDAYVGIEDMVPLADDNGKPLFLEHSKELNKNSHEDIPYYNEKVGRLYNHALSDSNAKGVLLLDVSCPRVYADDNIFDKAKLVQDLYPQILVVAIFGGGIKFKVGVKEAWEMAEKGVRISEVLEMLDESYGLAKPIFVFGFSRMQRGMSFRSSKRVPTHILLSLGDGYSIEGMIQALGRATCNGKHLLVANGVEKVQVLTINRDWDTAKKYQNFLEEFHKNVLTMDLESAFTLTVYEAKSDFIDGSKRNCGKNKAFRSHVENIPFEEPDSDDDEFRSGEQHAMKVLSSSDELTKAVYDVVVKCAKKYPCTKNSLMTLDELSDEYDDMWHERISDSLMKRKLKDLKKEGHVKEVRTERGGLAWVLNTKRHARGSNKKQRTK